MSEPGARRSEGSLRQQYARAVKAHGFGEDPAQRQAIELLERVRRDLQRAGQREETIAQKLLKKLTPGSAAAVPAVRGAYLWGGVGRGKTWLMDLFFQSLPFERKRRSHFHRFMHDVHEQLKAHKRKPDPLAHVAADIAASARVICFDELFVTDIADAMILGTLFGHLVGRGVTLVFTSNVPPSGLYRDGLQRQRFLPAIALLEQHTEVLNVDGGTDYRLRQLTQAAIYVQSGSPQAAAQLDALFEDLADGPGDAGGSIEIEGRRIAVRRESENVVWFDFDAICDGPRGKDDYIEIAREYQSVVISGVPVFDETRENAARRFIALVDEFYDRRVKLIVSAAAAPTQLYRGSKLRFEFERTASRLIEMQSEEYLASEHRA
ncbi:MAG: cell division protein ZapE [Steroidobacteraceae bacterium]